MGGTDFLFVNPSFLNGIGRTIDLFGTYTEYNLSQTHQEADGLALYNDIKRVGKDFIDVVPALENYGR